MFSPRCADLTIFRPGGIMFRKLLNMFGKAIPLSDTIQLSWNLHPWYILIYSVLILDISGEFRKIFQGVHPCLAAIQLDGFLLWLGIGMTISESKLIRIEQQFTDNNKTNWWSFWLIYLYIYIYNDIIPKSSHFECFIPPNFTSLLRSRIPVVLNLIFPVAINGEYPINKSIGRNHHKPIKYHTIPHPLWQKKHRVVPQFVS